MKSAYQARQERQAVKWAKTRMTQLLKQRRNGEPVWPVQSAANQVISECERVYNIGCASVVAKALKIQRVSETEEEIAKWEAGL